MHELYRLYGHRVRFVDVLVRQAHPGERHGAYRSYPEKLDDACRYQQEEAIPWLVAVDDLDGTVQRAYGGLSASVYLIDAEGRIAFYGIWGQAPALRQAIDDLLRRGGTGTPAGQAIDRIPHLGAAIVAGQTGPARGGRVALIDLELGFPGALALMTIGDFARPVLAPFVLRTTPLPTVTRAILLAGIAASGALALRAIANRH